MKTKKVLRPSQSSNVSRALKLLADGGSINCYKAFEIGVYSLRSAISCLKNPNRYGLKISQNTEVVKQESGNTRVVRYCLDASSRAIALNMLCYQRRPRFMRALVQEADQ